MADNITLKSMTDWLAKELREINFKLDTLQKAVAGFNVTATQIRRDMVTKAELKERLSGIEADIAQLKLVVFPTESRVRNPGGGRRKAEKK